MKTISIEDRFDDLLKITYAIKGLGMALEDCSTSLTSRTNKIEIEEITYALSDSIKLMAITLGEKLEDMKREITEIDGKQPKQASAEDIEALASDGRIPADMAGALVDFMNTQPAH